MTKWRKRLKEAGCESLLEEMIRVGLKKKLYSLHAPEVECIGKGKSNKRYEFGVKVSLATTHKSNFIVGMQAFPGNPYDRHTLVPALDQVERLTGG